MMDVRGHIRLKRERRVKWNAAWREDKAVDTMSKGSSVPFWTSYGFAQQQVFYLYEKKRC